jgi:glycosyltransferase involved in cell wall biosynthesis
LIEQAGLAARRFALIPPGIDAKRFNAPYSNPFTARGIHGHVLLTVSRLSAGKGLNDIIAVLPLIIKNHPDIQLVLVGEDFGVKKALMKQAHHASVVEHVHFLGKFNPDELIGAYQHADIFIHPSHYEAFGIVLAESLAAGTPVVARNIAAIPYVVPDQKAGLLFNTNEELAAHIITLLKNPSQREALAQFGQQHVRNNFTWDKSIKKITDLYKELGSS